MFEPLYSGQAEPGANDGTDLPALGQVPGTGQTSDRYGDVPLGVESAWPAGAGQTAS
jgi:hypothetical protein